MKRNILFTLTLFCASLGHTVAQNYVKTVNPTVESTSISGLTVDNSITTSQYFDDLGRPLQTVQTGAAQDKRDLATYQEHDAEGRKTNAWLPVVAPTGNNGNAIALSTLKTLSSSTYMDTQAYAKPVYESSPIGRVLEHYGPGEDWHDNGKRVKTEYLANSVEYACRKYPLLTNLSETQVSYTTENYPAYELYVIRTTDEDNSQINLEFKDKQGRVLLHRQMNGSTSYDTYYVYDIYGHLRAVLPPLAASASSSDWEEAIARYAYLYKYDIGRRMTGKKLPGADWITYGYDAADRLVFSKDGAQQQRDSREWTFHFYDNLNRLVLQGICKNGTLISIQSSKVIAGYNAPNTGVGNSGYTANHLLESPALHLVNYYDSYSFREQEGFKNNSNFPQPAFTDSGKGKLTGSISTSSDGITKIYTAYYYDEKGNLVNTIASNHLGGYDKTTVTYTFTGKPKTVQCMHTASGKTAQTEFYTYTYDHAERLTKTEHQLQAGSTLNSKVTLAEYTYDALGRLQTQKPHGSATNPVTYTYNIRNWLTGITSNRFTQNLYYNTGSGAALYNGNISSMTWKGGTESTLRGYKFTYDGLDRLNNAVYGETSAITGENRFGETPTYDKHGNITGLQRYGKTSSAGYGLIDDLSFGYVGNQMKYANDASTATPESGTFHFVNGGNSTGNEYLYDANGNMTKDLNKNITDIQYNILNLPLKVTLSSGGTTSYVYDAAGVKRQVKHQGAGVSQTTDYCGNVIYENGMLSRILTEEGYITLSGTTPTYHYYLKDHLGNNRVVLNQDGSTVEQVNHYYPFGGVFDQTAEAIQPYKYNGKELDRTYGLDLYDYSARYMDGALGRFTTMDPLAEKYYGVSPYAYCAGNPVKYVDPTGREIRLYNIIKLDNNGNPVVTKGLSSTTNAAVRDIISTTEGKAFFAQFAKAGDEIGEYKFTKDGVLSNVTLNLWDYSYEKGEMPSYAQSNSGSIGVSDDKNTVTLKVVSNNTSKVDIGETITHETQVHGYKVTDQINGKSTISESQDHKALKSQNTNHQGYKQYKSVQNQLLKVDEKYKWAFQEAQREYNKEY